MTISTISTVVGIVGASLAGYIYFDDKKADQVHVDTGFKQQELLVADTLQNVQLEQYEYRIKSKINELNSINRRETRGAATEYDLDRKFELEQELQLLRDTKLKLETKNSDDK